MSEDPAHADQQHQEPTTGISLLVSISDTKDLHLLERRLENLGIIRLRIGWMRAIRAFVTDLDTRSLFWLRQCSMSGS